jgi:trans-2,3-dihydro-3-hydroxyanthranilate isomerase
MTQRSFVIVDVFAETPFAGNQLAVFTDAAGLSDEQMQRAANEIGYSETTFMLPPESPETDLRLRIFTPKVELPFAGHPCVGSGFVATLRGVVPCAPQVVRLGTGVGPIEVRADVASDRHGTALMSQPFPELLEERTDAATVALASGAVGIEPSSITVDRSPIAVMTNGLAMAVVPVDSLAALAGLDPNPRDVARLGESLGVNTILYFTTETVRDGSSAHCRVYAPGAGVGEDPATGSAAGPFGVYLSRYGLVASDEMANEQGFEMGRPSLLRVSLGRGADGRLASVHVGGGVHVTGDATMYF